jgi:hypothetical protein
VESTDAWQYQLGTVFSWLGQRITWQALRNHACGFKLSYQQDLS